MGSYQADTFQCALRIHIQKAYFHSVAEHSTATSFFISCIKRLWDAVGHFLGSPTQAQQMRKDRAFQAICKCSGCPKLCTCENADLKT